MSHCNGCFLQNAYPGVPNEAAGELPLFFVVPRDVQAFSEQDVHTFVKEFVASYKRLRGGVRVIKAIPKIAIGEILLS